MTSRLRALRDHLLSFYLGDRFFGGLAVIATASALGFWFPPLFPVAVACLCFLVGAAGYDGWQLATVADLLTVHRKAPPVFSLGDALDARILVRNSSAAVLHLTIFDELPVQLQERNHRLQGPAAPRSEVTFRYPLRPTSRGVYAFGDVNVFVRTRWRLLERRLRVPQAEEVAVHPSLRNLSQATRLGPSQAAVGGQRRPRPVTRSYEFDQIKEYVRGDDLRTVNWKATARRGEVMVNTYEVERAQRIYSLIDKGRTMLMPFGGLSLLDHAINATLALTRVTLQKGDRAGLLTFSDKLGDLLPADNKPDQFRRMLQTLYRQREREGESDYDLLYYATRRFLPARSLLLLFTNFESTYALDRVMPVLRRVGRHHALVVVLFENTEIADLLEGDTPDLASVYRKSMARRYLQERQLMALQLRRNGIKVILVRPEELTGAVIDKYLELKGHGF
ncbi:DUF58 domain-containing protein [Lewinella sp. IMCC34183]|uniref:DUF58 domain-containing protein n=1 Tax=Lewinella sp. IMCC34183 TaxID=2248762 RepID=UPI000E25AC9D|nr:DUF58 domain-containing protein [Lewinella sp. IMCC34183]